MKSTSRPQEIAKKTSTYSEIAKIKGCEKVVVEQGPSGARTWAISAWPTRQSQT